MKFVSYDPEGFYDEMFSPDGQPRPYSRVLFDRVQSLDDDELTRCHRAAESALMRMGITFNVYGAEEGTERIWPFDIISRLVPASEWDWMERGLRQRIYSLNLFLSDVYHEQKIVNDGVILREIIESAEGFRPI